MKQALLIIDVQSALFDGTPSPFEASQVIARINQLSVWARKQAIPVIFIQHEAVNSVLDFNSSGWQLKRDLVALTSDFRVRKTTPNSFLRTTLKALLDEQSIEHLIICGYASEFCVDTTVKQAAALGYSIDLVADAHTTHDKLHLSAEQIREHHNQTLANTKSFGVKITAISVEDLVAK
jgi:nicotinamidase-related amidase